MKKIILFFCCASIVINSFAQLSDSTIQYKGGESFLERTIIKNLSFNENKPYDTSGINRFFFISLEIDTAGKINKVSITALGKILDNIETANIFKVLKKTDGNWINHTKEDQTIVLPLYCIYKDENPQKPPDTWLTYYVNWKKVKAIYLSPITSIVFPPIHDYRIKGK